MFDFLKPHFYFHSIHDVPISFYTENGIKAVLFDIDNTLEPYATEVPGERTLELFEKLRAEGIKIAVISNNHEPRVRAFCDGLDVSYSYDSAKPSSKRIHEAIARLGVKKEDCILVGDQLFTDIWAASNSKIRGVFVDRINNIESTFIKLKRVLEIPFVASIRKKGYGRIK